MFNIIKEPRVLWILFIATLLLTFSFSWISAQWDMVFLDGISSPEDARALVAGYNPEQIQVHIWTTAVVDVLYPLVYGSLFAGAALACFRHFGLFLAIPSFLVIPVDVAEGVVQIYGLLGNQTLLDWKAILTPLKFALFFAGFGIALVGWLRWLIQRVRGAQTD